MAEQTFEEMFDEEVDKQGDEPAGTLADTLTRDAPVEQEQFAVKPQEDEPQEDEPQENEEEFDPKSLARAIAQLDSNFKSQLRDLNGKFGGLNQQIGTLKSEVAAAKVTAVSDDAPSKNQIDNASQNLTKWNQLKDDFPEWAEAIEQRFSSQPKQAAPVAKPAEVETKADTRIDDMALQLETMRTKERHPDFDSVVKSDGFKVFMAGLPVRLQELASSPKAEDAIFLLDHYKSTAGLKTSQQVVAERQGKLRNAVSPVRGQATPRRAIVSLDDMSEEQLFNYYADQEEKRR